MAAVIHKYYNTFVKYRHRMGCEVFPEEAAPMVQFTVTLDPVVAEFYRRVAELTDIPVETVLSDALFKLAGELSLEAARKK